MTLNELIAKLQGVQPTCGEFQVTTWDGIITDVTFDTAKDGVCNTPVEEHNELSIEIRTE